MTILDLNLNEEFQQCFTRAGSPTVDCHCGREHVCINSYAFSEAWEDQKIVKEYIERDKTDENLILNGIEDTLCVVEVNGLIFAEDCECKGWEPYMKFILRDRTQIRDFLIKFAEKATVALEHEKTFNILKKKELDVIDDPSI